MTEQEKYTLLARIAELPVGGITYKTINGKRYPYLQWTENGRRTDGHASQEACE